MGENYRQQETKSMLKSVCRTGREEETLIFVPLLRSGCCDEWCCIAFYCTVHSCVWAVYCYHTSLLCVAVTSLGNTWCCQCQEHCPSVFILTPFQTQFNPLPRVVAYQWHSFMAQSSRDLKCRKQNSIAAVGGNQWAQLWTWQRGFNVQQDFKPLATVSCLVIQNAHVAQLYVVFFSMCLIDSMPC